MNKTPSEKPKKKPGPLSFWVGDLGENKSTCVRAPEKIRDLFQEKPFKRLMNWMALDKTFKKEILRQVPKGTPHAPKEDAGE